MRRAVVAFAASCGATDRERDDIAIAVSEALSNAVIHAYVGRERPGDVTVRARLQEQLLEVVVCDEGIGMLARSDSPGLGIGLALIGRLTERLEFETLETSGVRLRMMFAIGAS